MSAGAGMLLLAAGLVSLVMIVAGLHGWPTNRKVRKAQEESELDAWIRKLHEPNVADPEPYAPFNVVRSATFVSQEWRAKEHRRAKNKRARAARRVTRTHS